MTPLAALQGEWVIVTAMSAGTSVPPDGARLVIQGSTFARVAAEHTFRRTLQTDDSVVPWAMDLIIVNEPQLGQVFLGIYKIEGDQLTICHALPGHPRPDEFSSTIENANVLSISVQVSLVKDPPIK